MPRHQQHGAGNVRESGFLFHSFILSVFRWWVAINQSTKANSRAGIKGTSIGVKDSEATDVCSMSVKLLKVGTEVMIPSLHALASFVSLFFERSLWSPRTGKGSAVRGYSAGPPVAHTYL